MLPTYLPRRKSSTTTQFDKHHNDYKTIFKLSNALTFRKEDLLLPPYEDPVEHAIQFSDFFH